MYTLMHPTTLVLVDDNVNFLKSTMALVNMRDCYYIPYENPTLAVNHLRSVSDLDDNDFFISLDEDNVYFSTLSQVYNPLRFVTVTTVISDYEMPIISGVEFFQRLRSIDLHKVMLTGIATNALAVSMMKDGLIDDFIRKSDFDFTSSVENSILKGKRLLFEGITNRHVTLGKTFNCDIYVQDDVRDLVDDMVRENNVIEYYALDEKGSFIFINQYNKISAVFVYDKSYISSKYNAIRNYIDPELFKKLIEGTKILTIPLYEVSKYAGRINDFVEDAIELSCGVKYVYIKDAEYLVDVNKITFFNDFKHKAASNQNYIASVSNIVSA